MGKRFGRNQKRKLQDASAQALTEKQAIIRSLQQDNMQMRRRVKSSIEIDCSVFRRHDKAAYEARMAAIRDDGPELWEAVQIDERQLVHERERFIEHASRQMAYRMADAIGNKW